MLQKSFRILLFPFSIIYGAIILLRNWLFDKKIFQSASFNFPIICVGNLAVGGTGKSPMVEMLVRMLKDQYQVATLSRGYKRKTKGFAIAGDKTTALEIGDEPMQFHIKFPDITVSVGEERLVAIPQLLHDRPQTNVIILDDAFQHRAVKAGLNIVLTDYSNLYTRDFMLPTGDLRDVRGSIKRAHLIVVTKCRTDITAEKQAAIIKEINPGKEQRVFFMETVYTKPYHLFTSQPADISFKEDILLVTGIANPKPLKDFITQHASSYDMLRYPDHHIFDLDDLEDIRKHFTRSSGTNKIILTTEKDAVRLAKFESELKEYPIYVLPVKHRVLFGQQQEFEDQVRKFISSFSKTDT